MASHIGRREFLATFGGAAVAWPLTAGAQQGERMRRIGVLINVVADEQDSLGLLSAFRQALQQLGWSDGGNVRIETRVAKGNPERLGSDSA
jgi:putative tryptophan/tyrosine transport system substrate-binding protein